MRRSVSGRTTATSAGRSRKACTPTEVTPSSRTTRVIRPAASSQGRTGEGPNQSGIRPVPAMTRTPSPSRCQQRRDPSSREASAACSSDCIFCCSFIIMHPSVSAPCRCKPAKICRDRPGFSPFFCPYLFLLFFFHRPLSFSETRYSAFKVAGSAFSSCGAVPFHYNKARKKTFSEPYICSVWVALTGKMRYAQRRDSIRKMQVRRADRSMIRRNDLWRVFWKGSAHRRPRR